MKTALRFLVVAAIFTSCKTINYFPPTPNVTMYNNQGEVHLTGDLGVSNAAFLAAKGGVAITDNISFIGTYGGGFSKSYKSSEGEFGVGYNTPNKDGLRFGIWAGYGLGNNTNQDSGATYKSFFGSFTKPWGQVAIGFSSAHFESGFALKFDYINYSGQEYIGNGQYASFTPGNMFYEPYFYQSVGGEHFRFEAGMGFAIKREAEWGYGMRVSPFQFNLGFYILLNRKNS